MRAIPMAMAMAIVVARPAAAEEPARARPAQEAQADEGGRQGYLIAGWVAAGLAVAATGSVIYSRMKVDDLEDQAIENVRRRGLSGSPCEFDFNQQICHDGERWARYGTVFVVATLPISVAAAYLLYKGYTVPAVTPVVGPGAVGAAATIRF